MDIMDKLNISASMLLTGFTIVFAVLFFLIFLIWLYGRIITNAQTKAAKRKTLKIQSERNDEPIEKVPVKTDSKAPVLKKSGISDEVVAVISAAVYSTYGSPEKVKIKSIKKSSSRSAWANAGILNNTRPF